MITFPTNPTTGQEFVATNGATYVWLGNRWNSVTAIQNRTAAYIVEGGDSAWVYDELTDTILDGGTA